MPIMTPSDFIFTGTRFILIGLINDSISHVSDVTSPYFVKQLSSVAKELSEIAATALAVADHK